VIDEGEGGSTASNSWRHRWLIGLLFALVGLGAFCLLRHAPPAGPAGSATDFDRIAASLGGDRRLALGAIAALWLGVVLLVGRGGGTRVRGPSHAQIPPRSLPACSDGSFMRPGRGAELLALFARPAIQPLSPVGDRGDPDGGGHGRVGGRASHDDGLPPPMVRLFGPLTVEGSDGRSLGQRTVRGAIAYLAVRRAGASAEELLVALWPDDEPELARPRLWDVTRRLRRLLGNGLVRDGRRYALDPDSVSVDAWEVERLTTGDAPLVSLERALRLASAPPFSDVDFPWADGERRRLHAVRLDLLARVARGRLDGGEFGRALAAADELVTIDPLHELGWCLAMEAEAGLGARCSIIDRYETLSRELDRQLGLRPQSKTRATYLRLLGQT
jgi:DNA-binding SARP family transcriptional activator